MSGIVSGIVSGGEDDVEVSEEAAALRRGRTAPERYIDEMTDHIWADPGIGLIGGAYYHPDVVVHGSAGDLVGSRSVMQATVMGNAAYPDEFSRAEAVIWETRDEDSFVSSHRVLTTATHLGVNEYGAPTGRQVAKRAVAHCLVQEGVIVEEWVVRDEYAVAAALVVDVQRLVTDLADTLAMPAAAVTIPNAPLAAGLSGARPRVRSDALDLVVRLVQQVWNERMLQRLPQFLASDVLLVTTRMRVRQGLRQYSSDLVGLLSAFPDAVFHVVDLCTRETPGDGHQVALVWVMHGSYCGAETYGPRTGLPVQILGVSHFTLTEAIVTEEVRVFDELTLMAQIDRDRRASTA